MKLYEIDTAILTILSFLEPDENGALPENCDELFEELKSLEMERQKKLENVAKYVLNVRSEVTALKEEESRLSKRRKVLENKEKRLLSYLDNACQGKKTDLGVATLSYRKSERVEISDNAKAQEFLKENGYEKCIHYYPSEIYKDEVKALIGKGTEVPGVEIVSVLNASLR